jgi:diaminopimelate epimerase
VSGVRLTKHHGLGNDFLVLLDREGDHPVTPELVRELCDRHVGIGADGLLRATPTPTDGVDARMELYNADGSVAEMSGNGIRCLGQALLLAGWTARDDQVVIATHAGVRTLTVHQTFDDRRWNGGTGGPHGGGADQPGPADVDAEGTATAGPGASAPEASPAGGTAGGAADASRTVVLSVDMGPARLDGEAPEWTGGRVRRAVWADMGNPHLVAEVDGLDEAAVEELVALGEQVNAKVPGGANVHFVVVGPGDAITVRTYERGVGLTQACGTGACAAAAVAQQWEVMGPSVTVDMPGGQAVVHVGSTVTLTGPATAVAAVDFPWPA